MFRLVGSLYLGAAAFFLARGLNLPVWRDGAPGDSSDIALLVAMGVFFVAGAIKGKTP